MNLLFVCTGNTCRSAMAEAIAKKWIADHPEEGKQMHISSAGLMCAGVGSASAQAIHVAEEHGCDLSQFVSKQLTESMVEAADYVFVMTRGHKQMLESAMPQYRDKIFLLCAYAEGDPSAPDIPDPFGGSEQAYAACFDVLQEQIAMIFEKLK